MAKPTPQDISQIIEKLEALKSRKSDFWKAAAKKAKKKTKAVSDGCKVVAARSADKGLASEEFLPLFIQGGRLGKWAEGKLLRSPTSELQRLSDELIPELYKSGKIQITDEQGVRTKEGKRLDGLRDAVARELKRRDENVKSQKQAAREAVPELCKAVMANRLLRDGWPEDIQTLIDQIDLLLCPYYEFLKANGSWGADEQKIIEEAMKSTQADDLKKVVHEFEKVKYKMEVEPKLMVPQQHAQPTSDSKAAQNINIIHGFQGILGNVRAENVQTGDHTSINKKDEPEKKKGILRRLWWIIAGVIGFIASVLGILEYLKQLH